MHYFLIFLTILFIGELTTPQLSEAQSRQGLSTPSQTYRVGPNDELYIVVQNEDDLTTQVKISGEGKISFPLLGNLTIGGATVEEVEALLTNHLKAGYLKHPHVTVHIAQYRNVYINGAVQSPGGFPYEENLSVGKAITLAGGLTSDADESDIRITRYVNEEKKSIKAKMDTTILPDDQILIASHNSFMNLQ